MIIANNAMLIYYKYSCSQLSSTSFCTTYTVLLNSTQDYLSFEVSSVTSIGTCPESSWAGSGVGGGKFRVPPAMKRKLTKSSKFKKTLISSPLKLSYTHFKMTSGSEERCPYKNICILIELRSRSNFTDHIFRTLFNDS